jgi:hypothetical protein
MMEFLWAIVSMLVGVLFGIHVADTQHVLIAIAAGIAAMLACYFLGFILSEVAGD